MNSKINNSKEYIFDANTYPLKKGVRIIEASAGTGKTFSLAHLVLRLLTEEKYSMGEILVVSFTNATAAEIKSIICKRLLLALKALDSTETITNQNDQLDDVLKEWVTTKAFKKQTKLNWSSLLLEALENIDQADITTIHGFCYRTLRREAINCGSIVKPTIEEDNRELIKEIVHEYWKKEVLELDQNDLKGLDLAGFTIEELINNLIKIDNDASLHFNFKSTKSDDPKPLSIELANNIKVYWQDFVRNWEKESDSLESSLKLMAKELRAQGVLDTKPYTPNPRRDRSKEVTNWIQSIKMAKSNLKSKDIPSYESIRKKKSLLEDYYHPKNIFNIELRNKINNLQVKTNELQESIAELWDGPLELAWSHSLYLTNKLLQKKRADRGLMSNSGLIRELDPSREKDSSNTSSIKTKEHLYNRLSARYKVALVDEFQDTDPVQWRILKKAFGNRQSNLLVMVGDPKQAIYQFRGGDLNTYKQARQEADRIDVLRSNFRTTPSLMRSLNSLMSQGLQRSALNIHELIPKAKENPLSLSRGEYPLQLLNVINDEKEQNKEIPYKSKSKLESKIPNIVANHILKLLKSYKEELQPSDFCVLVNTHQQAESIRQVLSETGLPSRLVNKGDVFKSEAAYALQLFLNCLAYPSDSGYLKLVACSPLVQWRTEEFKSAEITGRIDALALKFVNWNRHLIKSGVSGCLAQLLEERTTADLSERGSFLSDLNQCAEIVQEEIHRKGLNPKGAAKWFSKKRNSLEGYVTRNRQPNSDIEESAINVITIHRSKGLQYKVVICPYLWQTPSVPQGPLWRKEEIGEWILSVNNTFKNETFKEAKEETLKEAERRAYVAMTRASKHLVIIWANVLRQEGNPLISFLFGPKTLHSDVKDLSLNKMNEWLKENKVDITIDSVRETKITKNWSKSTLNRILEVGPVPKRILDKDWGRHSYSSWTKNVRKVNHVLSSFPEIEEGKDIDEQTIEMTIEKQSISAEKINESIDLSQNVYQQSPLANFPRGAAAGECLHKILEKVDFQQSVLSPFTVSIIEEEFRKSGIDKNNLNSLQKALFRIFNTPLGGPLGAVKLNQINSNNRLNEVGFDIPLPQGKRPLNSHDLSKAFKETPNARFGLDYSKAIENLNINAKGFLTGSIDLVFSDNEDQLEGQWWVADWKSNWLGIKTKEGVTSCDPTHYSETSMEKEMLIHHYPLQAHLYLVALHRLLSWRLPNYCPRKNLGGYIYIFIRGIPESTEISSNAYGETVPGIFIEKAPIERIIALDKLLKSEKQ